MRNFNGEIVLTQQDFAAAVTGPSYDFRFVKAAGLLAVCAVDNSTVVTFHDGDVNVTANTIAAPLHGWVVGRKVAAATSGTLPGGLSATTYYVIIIDVNTIQLATSLANAQAGTAVDITSAASGGNHTLTPAALSTASVKLQWSPDDVNWFDLTGESQNITTTANLAFLLNDATTGIGFKSIRAVTAIAAGQVNIEIVGNVLKYPGAY